MRIKKILQQVHLWIGLALGLLFFVISFSGAIYTWAPEIAAIIYKKKVTPLDNPIVSISSLEQKLEHEFPKTSFIAAMYQGRSRSIEVLLYGHGTYFHAHMDPYSGAVLHIQDMNTGWLNFLRDIHRNLALGKIGRKVVHWGTLLFLLMMLTGIVMWWPSNKRERKQRLTIKWNASPKRLNYDLHSVLGFYATWILIFSVVTGLFWGFEIVRTVLRSVTGEEAISYDVPKSLETDLSETSMKFEFIDSLMLQFRNDFPSKHIRIVVPQEEAAPIEVAVLSSMLTGYDASHYYFDQFTSLPIEGRFEYGLSSDASLYSRLHSLVYDIHFGTVFGLPGRVLIFLASLIASSFPVTGFLIWYSKRRR